MKQNKFFILSLLLTAGLLLAALQSCNKEDKQTLFTTVMKSSDGDIRGITLNSDPETVKKLESEAPDSIADDYLLYNIYIPEKYADIKIEYSFDEKGLYSADISVRIMNPDTAKAIAAIDTLQTKITKLMTKKYGAPIKLSDMVYLWNYTSKSGTGASVQLMNNTEIEDTPSLEILVQTEVE